MCSYLKYTLSITEKRGQNSKETSTCLSLQLNTPPFLFLKNAMLELSQARHFVGVNFVLLQPGYFAGKLQFSNCCKYKHHLAFANNNIIRGSYKIINSEP